VDALSADITGAGCFVVNLPDAPLPVHALASDNSPVIAESAPRLAAVTNRVQRGGAVWFRVRFTTGAAETDGWVRVPEGVAGTDIYYGPRCP
jgi:hypothetical protein